MMLSSMSPSISSSVSPAAANTDELSITPSAVENSDEVFVGQLSDVLVASEAQSPAIAQEQTPETKTSEQMEPNAEEWLLAMIEQQLVQVQAREVTAPIADETTAALASAGSVVQPGKLPPGFMGVPVEPLVAPNGQVSSATDKTIVRDAVVVPTDKSLVDKTLVVNAAAQTSTVTPNADTDVSVATAANSNSAISSALQSGVQSVATQPDSVTAPPVINSVANSESAAQPRVQTQLNLHAPEAKFGEQLLHTLRDQVQVQVQQKIQSATIRLDPPELGSLEIYLSHESGRLTVNITASQADVARLIQQTSDRLRQELAGPQFTQVNVQTSAEGQSGQQQSRDRQRFAQDELILANEQPLVSNRAAHRSGDVLVTV